jgi:hypothetical protein
MAPGTNTQADYENLSYEEKCRLAEKAAKGDTWLNKKTGKKATITANSWNGVSLLHESGRTGKKQHHYFAYDFYPAPAGTPAVEGKTKPAVTPTPLKSSETPTDPEIPLIHYKDLDYQVQCEIAKSTRIGDVWTNRKTGRTATILRNNWDKLELQHETGRRTKKEHHYFASDYQPQNPMIPCPTSKS